MNAGSESVQTAAAGGEACYRSSHMTFFTGLYSNELRYCGQRE